MKSDTVVKQPRLDTKRQCSPALSDCYSLSSNWYLLCLSSTGHGTPYNRG